MIYNIFLNNFNKIKIYKIKGYDYDVYFYYMNGTAAATVALDKSSTNNFIMDIAIVENNLYLVLNYTNTVRSHQIAPGFPVIAVIDPAYVA